MEVDLSPDVKAALLPYLAVLRSYLDGDIADGDFESAFNPRYLAEPAKWPYEVFNQLDAVFAVAEEFEPDPAAREEAPFATDPEEMRRVITRAYENLRPLAEGS